MRGRPVCNAGLDGIEYDWLSFAIFAPSPIHPYCMILRAKIYRQRKYICIAVSSLLFYVLFARLGHLIYSVISLKANGFSVENITFDSEINDSCKISVASAVTCPINFELSDIRAIAQFDTENGPVQIAEARCTNIKISKFDNLQFDATVTLKSLDISGFSDLFPTSKLVVKLKMTLQVRFLLLPLAFGVKSTVFSFDPNKGGVMRHHMASPEENPLSDGVKRVLMTGKLHEDINNILGREVLRTLSFERIKAESEEFFELKVEAFPLISSKHTERCYINLKDYTIVFKKPARCMVIVKELLINKSIYAMRLQVPIASMQPSLSELLVDFWGKGSCDLEVSTVKAWREGRYVVKYQAVDDKSRLIMKVPFARNQRKKSCPMHVGFRNFRTEQNSLNCDFVCRKDTESTILRRVMHFLFQGEKLHGSLVINGAEACKLSFKVNELPNVVDFDNQENAILKCTADFDQHSKIVLKSAKVIEEASIKFQSNPIFVNGVEVCFNLGHPNSLVIDGNKVLFRKGAESLETAVPEKSCNILLEHELTAPPGASILCIKSELKSDSQFRDEFDYLKVDLENLDMRLLARKLDIRLKILRHIFGMQFPPGINGGNVIFQQGLFISKLSERSAESADFDADLLSYLIGSDMVLHFNDAIQVPVQIVKENAAAPKIFKDISLRYVPTQDISSHTLEISSTNNTLCGILAFYSLDPFAHGLAVIENRLKCNEVVLQDLNVLKLSVTEMSFSIVRFQGSVCFYFPRPAFVVLEFFPQDNQTNIQRLSEFTKFALGIISVGNSFRKCRRDEADDMQRTIDRPMYTKLVFEDTDQNFELDLCIDFPIECTRLSAGLSLSLFREGKVVILDEYTGEEVLELSASFSFTKEFMRSHLRVKGLVPPNLGRLIIAFSMDGRDIGRIATDVFSVGGYVSAIKDGAFDLLDLFSLPSDMAGRNIEESEKSTPQNLIHIEPRSSAYSDASSLDLDCGICSETINELISQKVASAIASLPLENRPKHLVLAIDAIKLPAFSKIVSFANDKSKGVNFFLDNLSLKARNLVFELEYAKREPLVMTPDEIRLHNKPILERMYGADGQREIEYYEEHYGSWALKNDIFDKFFDFHMRVGILSMEEVEDNKECKPHDLPSSFSHSSILCIIKYFHGEKRSKSTLKKLCPCSTTSSSQYGKNGSLPQCAKVWYNTKDFGMLAVRFFDRINVVRSSFSIILSLEDQIAVHMKAFGLLSDPYFDRHSFNIVVPYSIYNRITSLSLTVDTHKFKLYTFCGKQVCCLRFNIRFFGSYYRALLGNIAVAIVRKFPESITAVLFAMLKSMLESYSKPAKDVLKHVIIERDINENELVKFDRKQMDEEYDLVSPR